MRLNGAYTVPGTVKIEGGAIKLGASELWGDSAHKTPIVLCGGTFAAAANTSNALGRVTLAADSGLELEEGSCFTCYDQSSVEWNPRARLNITIPTNSHGEFLASVRFGTTSKGLTESQLASIRVNGRKVTLDKDGWIKKFGMTLVIR